MTTWRTPKNSSVCGRRRHWIPCARAVSVYPDGRRVRRDLLLLLAPASTGPPIGRHRRAVGATAAGAVERAVWGQIGVDDGGSLQVAAQPSCGEKTGAEMPSTALGPCLPGASCAGAAAEGAGNSSSTEAC